MSCSICLDSINNNKILNCNHEFCESCINSWLVKNNNCPLCRQIVKNNILESELELFYQTYKGTNIFQKMLWNSRPNLSNYLNDNRLSSCVNQKHRLVISKPYGIIINCHHCNKVVPFNWLG